MLTIKVDVFRAFLQLFILMVITVVLNLLKICLFEGSCLKCFFKGKRYCQELSISIRLAQQHDTCL